ncbi:hypothetical protein TNCV_4256721 [Trichonephila clavipes]|nr:hypothetical protein TNCV_4256721 [Trichonephila clavipes]
MNLIVVVIKAFPSCTRSSDIQSDLEDLGYSVTSCNQLISKRNKNPLPSRSTRIPLFNAYHRAARIPWTIQQRDWKWSDESQLQLLNFNEKLRI